MLIISALVTLETKFKVPIFATFNNFLSCPFCHKQLIYDNDFFTALYSNLFTFICNKRFFHNSKH